MIYIFQNATTKAIRVAHSVKDPAKVASIVAGLQKKSADKLVLLGRFHGGIEYKTWFADDFARFKLEDGSFKSEALSQVNQFIAKYSGNKPEPSVIVFGDSEFRNQQLVVDALNDIHSKTPIGWLLIGGDRYFENCASKWALQNKVTVQRFYPVKSHGLIGILKLGPQMLRANFDNKLLLVFVTNEPRPSTIKMIKSAKKRRIPVVEIQVGQLV